MISESHWKRIKTFSRAQLLKFITGVTSAVEYLHDKGIIHGSLRASNVLVDQDFKPKLRNIVNNQIAKRYGTSDVRYWSVELFKEVLNTDYVRKNSKFFLENAKCTKESDIWSLGVLMWEILSLGCVPYENIPFDQIGNYVQLGKFNSFSEIVLKSKVPAFQVSFTSKLFFKSSFTT